MCIPVIPEDKDFIQSYMANYLDVHLTTYSDYELDNLNIPIPIIIRLVDFYNTSIDYLVGRTNVKEAYPPTTQTK